MQTADNRTTSNLAHYSILLRSYAGCTSTLYLVTLYSLGRVKSSPVYWNTVGSQLFIACKRTPFCCFHSKRQFIHWRKHWYKNGLLVESHTDFPMETWTRHGYQGAPVHRKPALVQLDVVNKMFCVECVCIVLQCSFSEASFWCLAPSPADTHT